MAMIALGPLGSLFSTDSPKLSCDTICPDLFKSSVDDKSTTTENN